MFWLVNNKIVDGGISVPYDPTTQTVPFGPYISSIQAGYFQSFFDGGYIGAIYSRLTPKTPWTLMTLCSPQMVMIVAQGVLAMYTNYGIDIEVGIIMIKIGDMPASTLPANSQHVGIVGLPYPMSGPSTPEEYRFRKDYR